MAPVKPTTTEDLQMMELFLRAHAYTPVGRHGIWKAAQDMHVAVLKRLHALNAPLIMNPAPIDRRMEYSLRHFRDIFQELVKKVAT